MRTAFSTNALLSFYAWLDHRLLQDGGMFTNTVQQLYPQPTDSVLGSSVQTLAVPFRSLVWDSSISGANQFNAISGFVFNTGAFTPSGGDQLYSSILFPQVETTGYGSAALQFDLSFPAYVTLPSGGALLSGNSVFFDDRSTLTAAVRVSGANSGSYSDLLFTLSGAPTVILRGEHGMQMDWMNGRVILPAPTIPASATVSGSFAFRDFNLYFANQLADRLTFTDKPYLNSRFARALSGMPPPHVMTTPAILISDSRIANEMKALGGVYDSTMTIRLDVMAETSSQLENSLSLIRDARDLCFPELTTAQWALAASGDLKGETYSYQALFESGYTPSNLWSITRARCTKGGDNERVDQSIFLGRADLTVTKQRNL